jgi:alpha,alpha-trehalose phosphorylase
VRVDLAPPVYCALDARAVPAPRPMNFTIEPWSVRETALDLDNLARSESVFALSNGHIGLRANLDEGEPFGLPGTYLNGFYECRPLPYAEAGFGYPEDGQSAVNITNGKLIRLLVDDEPFDVRYGELRSHERVLDFRDGVLRRTVEWVSPTRQPVRVTSTRMVSLVHRSVAAILYEVEPLDDAASIVLQSELVANEPIPVDEKDPRAAAALRQPLCSEDHHTTRERVVLVHRTNHSKLMMAAGMDHVVDGPPGTTVDAEAGPDLGRVTVVAQVEPGQRVRLVKFVSYGWSSSRSMAALRDQVTAALAAARHTGWEGLATAQRAYLGGFWERSDVDIEGDEELQQAVRFALFHILQAGARAERRAIPAKGLTGSGYDGHTFWDSEMFVLPVLTYTEPAAVADALRWRHSTLDLAKERASQLGLCGAVFPWRTIAGEECSAYWPAGTAAFHIGADIAAAVIRYDNATGDAEFAAGTGLDLLVETARLWRSLGHHDAHGNFRIDGVTGPDEYSAVADNNLYTNLMAQRNLLAAADWISRDPDGARRLGVDDEEAASWRDAARTVVLPYDAMRRVHQQAEGFTEHKVWDFEHTPPETYPLLLHYPYFQLYRKQVVKQSDLVLAMHQCGAAFTPAQKLRNFDYYEAVTVRDSSLSACTQAVMAAEVGHLELAYDYLAEAALMDLHDLEHNTRDGLHIASLAGAWIAAVAGFGGMRDDDGLTFGPRLPAALTMLRFRMAFRGRLLRVTVRHAEATYELISGDPLEVAHHGEPIRLEMGAPVVTEIAPIQSTPRPRQPVGRAPARRSSEARPRFPVAAGSPPPAP